MPFRRYYRRYGSRRYGSRRGFVSQGTEYGKGGASYLIRRHSVQQGFDIPAGKAMIMPLLAYSTTEPAHTTLKDYAGHDQTVYPDVSVQEGSRVMNLHADLLITPKTPSDSAVLDFYVGKITTSFHDIKSGEIRGLSVDANDVPKFADDSKAATVITGAAPALSFNKQVYDYSVTIKHWWRSVRKNVIAAGVPVNSVGNVPIPRKCRRSNRGMFFGYVFMNDSTGDLHVDKKLNFHEIPLVQ